MKKILLFIVFLAFFNAYSGDFPSKTADQKKIDHIVLPQFNISQYLSQPIHLDPNAYTIADSQEPIADKKAANLVKQIRELANDYMNFRQEILKQSTGWWQPTIEMKQEILTKSNKGYEERFQQLMRELGANNNTMRGHNIVAQQYWEDFNRLKDCNPFSKNIHSKK